MHVGSPQSFLILSECCILFNSIKSQMSRCFSETEGVLTLRDMSDLLAYILCTFCSDGLLMQQLIQADDSGNIFTACSEQPQPFLNSTHGVMFSQSDIMQNGFLLTFDSKNSVSHLL